MININQTSENSKIYIQRNITNDEPVTNNYVTEDELQEQLKNINIPYLVVDHIRFENGDWGYGIVSGDYNGVLQAIKENKPQIIYIPYEIPETYLLPHSFSYNSIQDGIYVSTNIHNAVDMNFYYYVYLIRENSVEQTVRETRYVQEKLVSGENIKTINGNDILGEGDIEIDVDLTGYATEQWVDDKGYLKEIPEEYVTETELNDALANVGNGNIVELTQSEYNGITPEPDTLYVISDAPEIELPDTSIFVDKETLTYEIDAINISLSQKQDTLVSGVNIKTINGNDILGSGDIIIESGGNIVELTQKEYNAIIPDSDTLYLISDSNINTTLKTINGESIIGEGDIKIDVDLTGYATTAYVDDQLGNINNILENIIG